MHQQSWLLLAVAAVGTLASPVEPRASKLTVPLKHKVAPNAVSPKSLVQKGRARLANVNNEDAALHFNVDASSGVLINEDVSYIAPFKIGGTTYDLIVDTGCLLLFFLVSLLFIVSVVLTVWFISQQYVVRRAGPL